MKTSFKSLVCALLMFGATMPAAAGFGSAFTKLYKGCISHATIGIAAYPFIRDAYEGVTIAHTGFVSRVPLLEHLSTLSYPELFDYVRDTSMPYGKHALMLVIGGYAVKAAVDNFVNE